MMIASFSCPLRLKKAAASFVGTVGTNVVRWLTPFLARLQDQYERAPSGRHRFIASLKLKAAINFYHLAFKVAYRAQQVNLRLSGIDELILELKSKFGHLGGRYPTLIAPFDDLPDLFSKSHAACDNIEAQLSRAKQSIKVHWRNPRLDALRLAESAKVVESFLDGGDNQ